MMILGFSGGINGHLNAKRSLYDVQTIIPDDPRGGSCDNNCSRYFTVRALLAIRCSAIAPTEFSCPGAAMADTR